MSIEPLSSPIEQTNPFHNPLIADQLRGEVDFDSASPELRRLVGHYISIAHRHHQIALSIDEGRIAKGKEAIGLNYARQEALNAFQRNIDFLIEYPFEFEEPVADFGREIVRLMYFAELESYESDT